jgi:enoyl-CoA hydratase
VIAAVNGPAAGGGFALVLGSDIRIAAETARFGAAFIRIGLSACDIGTSWLLPRLVGVTHAADLLLSGRAVTGAETAGWGLWNDVLPDGEAALAAAHEHATRLATTVAPQSIRMTKRQLYDDLLSNDVGASLTTARRLLGEAMTTAEYREGVAALRERRPPRF